jgi:hypothetical protein
VSPVALFTRIVLHAKIPGLAYNAMVLSMLTKQLKLAKYASLPAKNAKISLYVLLALRRK